MKEYVLETISAGTTVEPFIAIRKTSRQQWKDAPTDKEIRFEFYRYDKITTGNEVVYRGDENYHYRLGALSSREIDEFTFIPYTPELLEKCEQIAKKFDEIQETINKMFASPDKALKALSGSKLLTFSNPVE